MLNAIETPAAVAEKYRNVFLSEDSGTLRVGAGRALFSLHFDRGMIAGADAAGDALGPIPDGIAGVVRIVEMAFAAAPDRIEFEPGPPPSESGADILRTVDLFLAGIRSMAGYDVVRDALSASDQRLVLRPNPSVPLERLRLRPIHGYALSRLAGQLSFGDLLATIGPDDEAEVGRFVFGLLMLGSVVFDPPSGPGPLRVEQFMADQERDSAREESETVFIRELYQTALTPNPYQVIGVSESSSIEQIRDAYEGRRAQLVPERFLARVRERMRKELSLLDARLTEAYLALQSGQIERMSSFASESDAPDIEQLSLRREMMKTEVAANLGEAEKLAETYYTKAKKYFTQADYHNCIQFCNQAIRQSDQTARYYFLLGEAQARNPDRRWQKMAEQAFLTASRLDPWNAEYLVLLGQFYKRQGFASRARRHLQRALEIQPGHAKAQEELDGLDPA